MTRPRIALMVAILLALGSAALVACDSHVLWLCPPERPIVHWNVESFECWPDDTTTTTTSEVPPSTTTTTEQNTTSTSLTTTTVERSATTAGTVPPELIPPVSIVRNREERDHTIGGTDPYRPEQYDPETSISIAG